jgi:hypothetical protein
MKTYSREWKKKKKKWVQEHKNVSGKSIWKVHYLQNDTEYSNGEYSTEKSAKEDLQNYNV